MLVTWDATCQPPLEMYFPVSCRVWPAVCSLVRRVRALGLLILSGFGWPGLSPPGVVWGEGELMPWRREGLALQPPGGAPTTLGAHVGSTPKWIQAGFGKAEDRRRDWFRRLSACQFMSLGRQILSRASAAGQSLAGHLPLPTGPIVGALG